MQGSKQIPLYFRQFNAGTISLLKARQIDTHFLTFQARGDTSHENNDIGIPDRIDRLVNIHFLLKAHVEIQLRITLQIFKLQFNVILLPCFHLQSIRLLVSAMAIIK